MGSDWGNLHRDLLVSILDRLGLRVSYFLNFNMVCKAWFCVGKDKQQTYQHRPPMLLIPVGQNGIWKLYNVMDDKLLDLQLDLSKKRFCGSSQGWLIAMEQSYEVVLINPLLRLKGQRKTENSKIRLPPVWQHYSRRYWILRCNYRIVKAALSADPILNANNCIVTVIKEDQCQLAFFRLNKDTEWTHLENFDKWDCIHEVVSIQDKFYAVGYLSLLLSFDNTAQSSSDVKLLTCAEEKKPFKKFYLISLHEKELLMVCRHIHHDRVREKRETMRFEVFKLDWGKCQWTKKESLKDTALFLGDNSSIAVLASKFPGCQPNCIYFNHDHEEKITTTFKDHAHLDFGVYDLKSQSINSLPYNKFVTNLMKRSFRPSIWFMPSLKL